MGKEFWKDIPLNQLSEEQWESLCDGCGKCCLNKLEDDGEVAFTWVSCRFLDCETCQCTDYPNRLKNVPSCIKISPEKLDSLLPILPQTCAYKLIATGQDLYEWHHLISGDRSLVHEEEISVKGMAISEDEVDPDDLDLFIIDEEDF
ncbi:YcgN family cysteine cluster protein [Bacteriovorax sp. Seq25_V]|uniref:YcgN family cysteine cluster protein n=1 Tax=Bacteriovorax sp. Seq25_V TaxID=1201288 RepID=UPI000389EB0F|nr:YcgN family cysteine cluster protein [Bacteriovorax sp. Seq25_V]EQC47466.1 hypothetical protein M900_0784 [Bacteriovorax sp. Seq25_V]